MAVKRNNHYLDNTGLETLWGKITSLVSSAVATLMGAIDGKADKATTLSGYGITDAEVAEVHTDGSGGFTDGKVRVGDYTIPVYGSIKGRSYSEKGVPTYMALRNSYDTEPTDNSTYAITSGAVYTALQGKQGTITAGTGLVKDGNTIGHSNSITARTSYLGSTTIVPRIQIDAQGHIVAYTTATIYPPTSAGTSGQIWQSDGSGAGVWQTLDTTPTASSKKACTSGGIKTAIDGCLKLDGSSRMAGQLLHGISWCSVDTTISSRSSSAFYWNDGVTITIDNDSTTEPQAGCLLYILAGNTTTAKIRYRPYSGASFITINCNAWQLYVFGCWGQYVAPMNQIGEGVALTDEIYAVNTGWTVQNWGGHGCANVADFFPMAKASFVSQLSLKRTFVLDSSYGFADFIGFINNTPNNLAAPMEITVINKTGSDVTFSSSGAPSSWSNTTAGIYPIFGSKKINSGRYAKLLWEPGSKYFYLAD